MDQVAAAQQTFDPERGRSYRLNTLERPMFAFGRKRTVPFFFNAPFKAVRPLPATLSRSGGGLYVRVAHLTF